MFVGILLRDLARDFGVEFESLRHREIFKISARADKNYREPTYREPPRARAQLFDRCESKEWFLQNKTHKETLWYKVVHYYAEKTVLT